MPKTTSLSLLMLCFAGILSTCGSAAEKPNFVWLISEDNSMHFLNLFDEHGAETPNITKLAAHGIIFENAFSNAPVCSVARSTLITSCHAPRIGTQFHRRAKAVPMPTGLNMFPQYLREAGYYTTNKHKTDYNAIAGKEVWDQSSPKASWRNRKEGQAFFHKQSFTVSHEGSLHFSRQVYENEKTLTDPKTVFVAPYHPQTELFKYTYARYHDRIKAIDAGIGDVVNALKKDGLLEDTFIFYFGDHGGVLPRGKGYAYESGLHIPLVVHVPDNWKHLAPARAGSRMKGFVSFIDFGPTLLKLAGIKVPQQVDGIPFMGKGITADEVNSRDEAFGYADRFDEKYDLVRTLRKGKYEYVRSYQPFNFDGLQNNYRYRMLAYQEWRNLYHAGKLDAVQSQFFEARTPEALYDIETDPHETNNLATNPEFKSVLLEMRKRLSEKVKSLPDLSMYPENHLVDEIFDNPTAKGQQQKEQIAKLFDIADLSLFSFADAESGIQAALNSPDPWQRYWGLIVCSCFDGQAETFYDQARKLSTSDENLLVRVRAAEFLGLTGIEHPRNVLSSAIQNSQSPVEANLMLNTLVMLRDGKRQYKFDVQRSWFSGKNSGGDVPRRLEYLVPDSKPASRPKKNRNQSRNNQKVEAK